MQNLKHAATAGMAATAVLLLAGCGMIKNAVDNAVEDAVEKGIEKVIEAGVSGDVDVNLGGELPAGIPAWLPIVDGEVKLSFAQDGGIAFNIESTMDEFDRVVAQLEADPALTVVTSQDLGGAKVRSFEGNGYQVSLQTSGGGDTATVNYLVVPRD